MMVKKKATLVSTLYKIVLKNLTIYVYVGIPTRMSWLPATSFVIRDAFRVHRSLITVENNKRMKRNVVCLTGSCLYGLYLKTNVNLLLPAVFLSRDPVYKRWFIRGNVFRILLLSVWARNSRISFRFPSRSEKSAYVLR